MYVDDAVVGGVIIVVVCCVMLGYVIRYAYQHIKEDGNNAS